ncbi:MAG: aspartyl-phosphate phosphatase Spo0E family protein [Syntrophomonadaceae bacterium]
MKQSWKVEKVRAKLVKLGMEKGFQDPGVIKLSQALDRLINKIYMQDPGLEAGRTKMVNLQHGILD